MSNVHAETQSVLSVLPTIHFGGRRLFDPLWAEETHATQSCELLHILRGKVELELGGRLYRAGPGDLLFVPAHAPHRDLFDIEEGLETFMVFFSWAAETEFFSLVSNDALRKFDPMRKAEMIRQCELLRQDMRHCDAEDQLTPRARLLTLLLTIRRDVLGQTIAPGRPDDSGSKRRHGLIVQAKRYLKDRFAGPVCLDDIAKALDVSTYYLSHVFSEENDFSLFTYLTALRMERARELLQTGRLNVSEVARAVGYENSNYFSKVFRKHFGSPPGDHL